MVRRIGSRLQLNPAAAGEIDEASATDIGALFVAALGADRSRLLLQWRNHLGGSAPAHLPTWLLARLFAYRVQAAASGGLDAKIERRLLASPENDSKAEPFACRAPATREGESLRPGALLAREWRGRLERVTVLEAGFAWNGKTYGSLSEVAKPITGTSWNGHRFFALRAGQKTKSAATHFASPQSTRAKPVAARSKTARQALGRVEAEA